MTTDTQRNIQFIISHGLEVIDHQDGTFTVYDSYDPENGWKIVRNNWALTETINMINSTKIEG